MVPHGEMRFFISLFPCFLVPISRNSNSCCKQIMPGIVEPGSVVVVDHGGGEDAYLFFHPDLAGGIPFFFFQVFYCRTKKVFIDNCVIIQSKNVIGSIGQSLPDTDVVTFGESEVGFVLEETDGGAIGTDCLFAK